MPVTPAQARSPNPAHDIAPKLAGGRYALLPTTGRRTGASAGGPIRQSPFVPHLTNLMGGDWAQRHGYPGRTLQ